MQGGSERGEYRWRGGKSGQRLLRLDVLCAHPPKIARNVAADEKAARARGVRGAWRRGERASDCWLTRGYLDLVSSRHGWATEAAPAIWSLAAHCC